MMQVIGSTSNRTQTRPAVAGVAGNNRKINQAHASTSEAMQATISTQVRSAFM
jgi:hypothetical protein